MAILEDPLFGDEARGQVAKALIFKRSEVHPRCGGGFNTRQNWTPAHIAQANAWRLLCLQWQSLSATDQQKWKDGAPGVLTGFNYFVQCAGIFPWPPPYEPPPGDQIHFNFTKLPYTPPAGNNINFNLGDWPA